MPPVTPPVVAPPVLPSAPPAPPAATTTAPDASFDPLAAAEAQANAQFANVSGGSSFQDMPKDDGQGGLTHILGTLFTKGADAAKAELLNGPAKPDQKPATVQLSALNLPVNP